MCFYFDKRVFGKALLVLFFAIISIQVRATNLDMCQYELDGINKRLNKVYQKILTKLDYKEQEKLRKAQRQWIIFRDLDCEWAFVGNKIKCSLYRTKNRLSELTATMFNDRRGNYTAIDFEDS